MWKTRNKLLTQKRTWLRKRAKKQTKNYKNTFTLFWTKLDNELNFIIIVGGDVYDKILSYYLTFPVFKDAMI